MMKKMKLSQKQHKPLKEVRNRNSYGNKKRNKNSKLKSFFKYLFLIIFILLLVYIAKLIIGYKIIQFFDEKKVREIMSYKGIKLKKKKIIEDYLSFAAENENHKLGENNSLYHLFYLDEYPNNKKKRLEIKLKFISKLKNNRTKKIDTFFMTNNYRLGNSIISLNNAIFYCEIMGCKKILLNEQGITRKWLIKNPIYIKKLDIIIMLGSANCNDDNVLCLKTDKYWEPFYPIMVKPQIRTQYIKEELLRNLPNVKTDPNDLYIHLRAADVFSAKPSDRYAQPPLCFYEKIIDNNKFKNIYIIASDRDNIILDALINKYKYIIFEQHDFQYDFSLIVHAYNFAISVSSFSVSAIKFNDNLKHLWEYDIFRLSEKFFFLHHHLYKFDIKYKIHTMKPSDIYAKKMFFWERSESQLKLMLEDKCPYDFVITKPNR